MREFQLMMTVLSAILFSQIQTTTTSINDSRLLSINEESINSSLTSVIHRSSSSSIESIQNLSSLNDENERFRRRLKSTSLPEFSSPIGNVTAVLGRDVRLICTVEHLGQYQVAWLKEETKTILSIDTNIIITNYRIFLIPDEEERKWVLHIKDVQESDRGFYQCQVNTSPMRSTRGYLEVVVPPTIIESQTSQVVEVIEHSNVSLYCKANGHPKPSITWRRDDGSAIKLAGKFESITEMGKTSSSLSDSDQPTSSTNSHGIANFLANNIQLTDIKSDKLSLYDVDRSMGGIYVCTASNGIPTHVSKKIILYIKFPPRTSVQNKYVSVSLGDKLEIDCLIEAFPKATSYWSKNPLPYTQRLDQASPWPPPPSSYHALSYKRKQQLENEDDLIVNPSSRLVDVNVDDEAPNHESLIGNFNKHRLTSIGYPSTHPHNRLQLREVDGQNLGEELDSSGSNFQTLVSPLTGLSKSEESKGYVTVKQTPINSYTYKIKMVIAKMQQDDYGQYTCVSSNSLGNSETQVIVTRADKVTEKDRPQLVVSKNSSTEDDDEDHQSDPLLDSKPYVRQQSRHSSSTSGNRVVYDENYLQAIKTRQNNYAAGTIKLQQKLKLRQSAERNGLMKDQPNYILTFSALLAVIYIKLIVT